LGDINFFKDIFLQLVVVFADTSYWYCVGTAHATQEKYFFVIKIC